MLLKRIQAHLHWRIAILFTGLILVLFAAALLVVNHQNIRNAETNIRNELRVTADVFTRLIEFETQSLQDLAKPATSDHAFRQVFIEGDKLTLESAMRNLVARIENVSSGIMMLVDFDLLVIASTLNDQSTEFAWPALIQRAEKSPRLEASGLVLIGEALYQVIVAPLLIPDPEAWVLLGFPIDQSYASNISQIGLANISVYSQQQEQEVTLHASSLAAINQLAEQRALPNLISLDQSISKHSFDSERFLTLNTLLDRSAGTLFSLGVHGSLDKALEPYRQLEFALMLIFIVGLLITCAGAYAISRSITQPIKALDMVVAKIGSGDFKARAEEGRKDEIGSLARTVNQMASDLEEKQKIRNLLGRVVSNEIAEELLKNDIELGGEEREVTVLFTDIRDFTGLSEIMSPTEMISLLNRYFQRVTDIIESQKGVVDKYIGDAVMAVFGAPIKSLDHAKNAVVAGQQILEALTEFNANIEEELGFKLRIGVGISTGTVVAGNLGSESRMNYTLIGDSVNIAARLESLTKELPCPLIASRNTYDQAPNMEWQNLGEATVRGRRKSIEIFGLGRFEED